MSRANRRDPRFDPTGNARDRRRLWRMRSRLLKDALEGRVGPLQGTARWHGGIVHYGLPPRRPRWARRLSHGAWLSIVEWAIAEFPMARAFHASTLQERGDEAGLRRLYGSAS